MLNILASGTLVSDPKSRTSATGKLYCTASMRTPIDGAEAILCSLICFNAKAVGELLAHAKGDTIACTGKGSLSSWTAKDGTEARGLSIVVERIMSPYMLNKKRQSAREPEGIAA